MNNKRIIIGVTNGIIAAILWSVVFINVLNSMAGIGIGICLGISFGISGSLIFSDLTQWENSFFNRNTNNFLNNCHKKTPIPWLNTFHFSLRPYLSII